MIHHFYIVDLKNPLRKIREVDAEIKVCGKTTWAIEPDHKRRLLGGSAFYTRKQAECRKIGLVAKIEQNTFLRSHPWMTGAWDAAHKQMKEYRANGTVH